MLVRLMVSWVHPQVMVFLGKVKNPATDAMERNLDAARTLIDVLAELQAKTEGRLEADDQRLLQHALTELRMNWLDESNKGAGAASSDGGNATVDDMDDHVDDVDPADSTPSAGGTPPAG